MRLRVRRARVDCGPLVDALRLIARHGCESYTSGARCFDPGSGRIRGARYGSEAWCDPCIAAAALDPARSAGGGLRTRWWRRANVVPLVFAVATVGVLVLAVVLAL